MDGRRDLTTGEVGEFDVLVLGPADHFGERLVGVVVLVLGIACGRGAHGVDDVAR